jgi:hypothetical protein
MVKRYHGSFPSFSYEFDSRYPLQYSLKSSQSFLGIAACLAAKGRLSIIALGPTGSIPPCFAAVSLS